MRNETSTPTDSPFFVGEGLVPSRGRFHRPLRPSPFFVGEGLAPSRGRFHRPWRAGASPAPTKNGNPSRTRKGTPTPTNRRTATAAVLLALATLLTTTATHADDATPDPSPLERIATAARAALVDAGLARVETEAAGRRLVVFRGGEGPDLVLLHGSGQQAGAWAAVAPAFVGEYTVHVPDLPGHGDSAPAEGTLPMDVVVAGIEDYLVSLERPAILVGNSLGAWLATLQAHRHPELVTRAVLVNGGALSNVPAAGLTLTPPDREAARRVMAALRDPGSPPLSDELLDDIVRRGETGPTPRMMAALPSLMAHLLDGKLGEVTPPVDLLWGASDQLMPLAYAQRMASQLPRSRLVVLGQCGHIPPAECPERFVETLRGVLAMPPAATPAIQAPAIQAPASDADDPAEEDGR